MPGAQFVSHRGKSIFHIDFRGCSAEQALPIIADAKKRVAALPPASVLVLTDITGAHYNERIVEALKGLAAANKPFVKASAVVGVTGIRKVIFQAIKIFSSRQMDLFDTEREAKDWLAARA